MLAVNQLVQDAYDSIGMTGLGEAVGEYGDGNFPVVAVKELNRLITQLNNEGFIAMSQKYVDCPCVNTLYFRKLVEGEEPTRGTVNMEAPEKVESVARKVGESFVVLDPGNLVQMSQKNPNTTALSWTYNTEVEDVGEGKRVVGVLSLDGNPRNTVRVWYNSKLVQYRLDETIYLSDLYNELLMSGLCYRLALFFKLPKETVQDLETDFLAAKTLIKRNNVTQRMLQSSRLGTDWRDSYNGGLSGRGM